MTVSVLKKRIPRKKRKSIAWQRGDGMPLHFPNIRHFFSFPSLLHRNNTRHRDSHTMLTLTRSLGRRHASLTPALTRVCTTHIVR
jgi:hypothetical protein